MMKKGTKTVLFFVCTILWPIKEYLQGTVFGTLFFWKNSEKQLDRSMIDIMLRSHKLCIVACFHCPILNLVHGVGVGLSPCLSKKDKATQIFIFMITYGTWNNLFYHTLWDSRKKSWMTRENTPSWECLWNWTVISLFKSNLTGIFLFSSKSILWCNLVREYSPYSYPFNFLEHL